MTLRHTHPTEDNEILDNTSKVETLSSKSPLSIRIISHNIRYATTAPFKGEERWPVRRPLLCSQFQFHSQLPETFICLQEVLHIQLVDILASLNSSSRSGKEWDYIGVGRDDGKQRGEYSPIFYRPSIWQLKSWENRWLSKTPKVPGKGWDASSIRILTIGRFVHIETGQNVIILSTHLDDQGAKARKESAKLILEWVDEFLKSFNPAAILLAGDFNSPEDDGAYQVMTSVNSAMEDIATRIPRENRYGNENTWTSFGYVDNTPSRIDFIFSRKADALIYKSYGVLANRFDDGIYLSDHRAVVADVQLKI